MTSAMLWRESGGTKLGCVAVIFVWLIVGYLGYRVVPVYLEKDAFEDELMRIAGRASQRGWEDRQIVREALRAAKERGWETSRDDVTIRRPRNRPEVTIILNCKRTEMFPGGYFYDFHFRIVAEGSLGI